MDAGFEDYKVSSLQLHWKLIIHLVTNNIMNLSQTIRTDPDLEGLRESEEFEPLLKQYDEPFINENAIKAISNIFGFMGGKKWQFVCSSSCKQALFTFMLMTHHFVEVETEFLCKTIH